MKSSHSTIPGATDAGNRNRAARRGQGAVELALCLPLLSLLAVVAADAGRAFLVGIEVTNAARAGVEFGVQDSTTAGNLSGMETAATNDGNGITGLTATAKTYCQCGTTVKTCPVSASITCLDPRGYVEVDTSAPFKTLLHYPGIPTSLTLTGKAIMRYR
jgi:Flp pilus assembly protein TadG